MLYLPWNVFERDAIADGEWPLWDPYSFSGSSFAANVQSQLYYPLTWLLWLLPLATAIQTQVTVNIWLAGAGMYLLCRHFRVSAQGALLAGLGFAGSGVMQLAMELPGIVSPYGWLPWMLLALDKALVSGGIRWMALTVLACGLQLVSGNPQWAIYSYFALACWIAWRAVAFLRTHERRVALKSLLTGVGALFAGVLLAAVHLVPFLELYTLSSRGGAIVSSRSAPVFRLLQLIMPGFFGAGDGTVGAPLVHNDLWYVGIGVLALALLGLTQRGDAQRWLWLAICLLAVGVGFGIGPLLYVRWLPGMSSMLPARIGFLFIFAACLLAGMGLDAWLRACRVNPRRAMISLVGLVVIAAAVVTAAQIGQSSTDKPDLAALRGEYVGRACLFLLVFGVIISLPLVLPRLSASATPTGRAVALLILAVTAVDLWSMVPGYNAFVSAADIRPVSPAVDWLRSRRGEGRVLGYNLASQPPALVPNVQMLYGFESVSGYDSLHTTDYDSYWGAIDTSVQPPQQGNPYSNVFVMPQVYSSTLADLLNVRFVLSTVPISTTMGLHEVYNGEVVIYENPNALPRAFVVRKAESVPRGVMLARLTAPDFDPRKIVLLDSADSPPIESGADVPGQGIVQVTTYKRNSASFTVDMPKGGWLVLTDRNYPGWTATVDGRDEKIYTANYLLRSLYLKAGRHEVVFRFLPTNFVPALAVSLVILVATIIAAAGNGWPFRRRIKVQPRSGDEGTSENR